MGLFGRGGATDAPRIVISSYAKSRALTALDDTEKLLAGTAGHIAQLGSLEANPRAAAKIKTHAAAGVEKLTPAFETSYEPPPTEIRNALTAARDAVAELRAAADDVRFTPRGGVTAGGRVEVEGVRAALLEASSIGSSARSHGHIADALDVVATLEEAPNAAAIRQLRADIKAARTAFTYGDNDHMSPAMKEVLDRAQGAAMGLGDQLRGVQIVGASHVEPVSAAHAKATSTLEYARKLIAGAKVEG